MTQPLARAVLKDPETMRLAKGVVMMGGVFGVGNYDLELGFTEHNICCDPEAAGVVFASGLPITLFPLDVTTQVALRAADVDEIGRSGRPLAELLRAELSTWLTYIREQHGRDFTHMHDPLAAAFLIDPGIMTRSATVGVKVERAGEFTTGATVPVARADLKNVTVALEVDVARFQRLFTSRLAGGVTGGE